MIRAYLEYDDDQIIDVWSAASSIAHPFLTDEFIQQEKINIREKYLPNTMTWVYELEDKIIGFISMMDHEIGAIFVHPDFHRKGIGTQLINYVIRKYPKLSVSVFKKNMIGISFYEKYGFEAIEEELYPPANEILIHLNYNSKK